MEVKLLKYNKKHLKNFPKNLKTLLIILMMYSMKRVYNKKYLEIKLNNQKKIYQKLQMIRDNYKQKYQIYSSYKHRKIKMFRN